MLNIMNYKKGDYICIHDLRNCGATNHIDPNFLVGKIVDKSKKSVRLTDYRGITYLTSAVLCDFISAIKNGIHGDSEIWVDLDCIRSADSDEIKKWCYMKDLGVDLYKEIINTIESTD